MVILAEELNFKKPPCLECGCGFRCISTLCPYGYDPFADCFQYMNSEQKKMFRELVILRSLVARL